MITLQDTKIHFKFQLKNFKENVTIYNIYTKKMNYNQNLYYNTHIYL